jgi:streptogramin lyase
LGIAFDGANIWVTNDGSGAVAKLLASTGATVGTYPAGITPYSVVLEGTNIWVTTQLDNSVAKLLTSTGASATH